MESSDRRNDQSNVYYSLSMNENNSILRTPETKKSLSKEQQSESLTPISTLTQRFCNLQGQTEICLKNSENSNAVQSKRFKTDLGIHKHQSNYLQHSKSLSFIENKENIPSMKQVILQEQQITVSNETAHSLLRKSMSLNDTDISSALSSSSANLIGDFTKPLCLPLVDDKHCDLKSISSDTLAKLLRDEFKDIVASYKIIDCRYPYEYEGGHIVGAYNLYTQEQILEKLVKCKNKATVADTKVQENDQKRDILVFHCEFSSKRGPKLLRFLRSHDRCSNSHLYPALYYPEIYLLYGGYKEFFKKFPELCDPNSYRPMLDPSFRQQYKQYRTTSKSYNYHNKDSSSKHGVKKPRLNLLL